MRRPKKYHYYWVYFPQGIRYNGYFSDGEKYTVWSSHYTANSIREAKEIMEKYNAPLFEKIIIRKGKRLIQWVEYKDGLENKTDDEIEDMYRELPEVDITKGE